MKCSVFQQKWECDRISDENTHVFTWGSSCSLSAAKPTHTHRRMQEPRTFAATSRAPPLPPNGKMVIRVKRLLGPSAMAVSESPSSLDVPVISSRPITGQVRRRKCWGGLEASWRPLFKTPGQCRCGYDLPRYLHPHSVQIVHSMHNTPCTIRAGHILLCIATLLNITPSCDFKSTS